MVHEAHERQEVVLLPFRQVPETVHVPAFVRAVEIMMFDPVLHRLGDLRSRGALQINVRPGQVVLHHIMTLLRFTEGLRVSDAGQDMLHHLPQAEPVEGGGAAFDRVELRAVIGQELLRHAVPGEAFLQEHHRLVPVRRYHHLRADDEAGMIVDHLEHPDVLSQHRVVHLPERVSMLPLESAEAPPSGTLSVQLVNLQVPVHGAR